MRCCSPVLGCARAWDISAVAAERVAAYARQHGCRSKAGARSAAVSACAGELRRHRRLFLDRALIPHIVAALRPGGLVFYQTFTRSRVSDAGPGNPEFRLAENELLSLFAGLQLLVYREEARVGDLGQGFRDEAMIVARKPAAAAA